MNNDIQALQRILKQCRTIAVVGLSAEWHRPSYFAAKYMQSHGYRIIPVNPRYAATNTAILGETCYATLADIPHPIDMVDVFRKAEDVLPGECRYAVHQLEVVAAPRGCVGNGITAKN